jgi:hypothetical protein
MTAILQLLLQVRHKSAFCYQLLLLRADNLDQVLHHLLVVLAEFEVLVTLRALCRTRIRHNAWGLLTMIFWSLRASRGIESAMMLGGYLC